MHPIPIIDLSAQYRQLKDEINNAVQSCLESTQFIGGSLVQQFETELASYINIKNVIGCANGTDAIQIALMALNLPKGSQIIVPAFTYIAPVEVIKLLGFEIIYADVDPNTFNITLKEIKRVFTNKVKAVIAVHLFGQICDIQKIYEFTEQNKVHLIEDNAQSLGAEKIIKRDNIITTSFFPTKNLGAYGDAGAILTNDNELAKKMRRIASHGQHERYYHNEIGINSRLDALQATILQVKLKYLDNFIEARQKAADFYDQHLAEIKEIKTPKRTNASHSFHQYTIKVTPMYRNALQFFLKEKKITTTVYYPLPCYQQGAYHQEVYLSNAEMLCQSVLSLPIYPEITTEQLLYICDSIKEFFDQQ
jgi:dTDP-4-amino-4,6-dideoxygalactose transaminase